MKFLSKSNMILLDKLKILVYKFMFCSQHCRTVYTHLAVTGRCIVMPPQLCHPGTGPVRPANEHLNIMKQMYIDGSSSICSAKCTNVAYISASINIVKISITIVSRQRHFSWNSSLDVLNLSVTTLRENRFR